MTTRRTIAPALALALGLTLFSAVALAQLTGSFPGSAQTVALPYYVTLVEATVKGNQSGVTQELRPARGSTPEQFILTIAVSDNGFSNGALTLKNGYQTLATRTSFRVKLIVDSPAQHPSLYQYLLHCSGLAGSAFNGYRHGPTNTCTIGEGLGKIHLRLEALPNQPMSLSQINGQNELIINLTNLQYNALQCSA